MVDVDSLNLLKLNLFLFFTCNIYSGQYKNFKITFENNFFLKIKQCLAVNCVHIVFTTTEIMLSLIIIVNHIISKEGKQI